ncbi:MAG: hypothetical protein AAGF35_04980 [Pseudomonadota bacterium]
MKKILKLFAAILLVLALPAASLAQMSELQNSTPEQRAEIQDKWMQDNLSLDEKTTEAVSAINLKYAKETQTLIDSDSPNLQKLKAFRSSAKAKDAELESVLSPEQYSQYEAKKSELQSQIREKLQQRRQANDTAS